MYTQQKGRAANTPQSTATAANRNSSLAALFSPHSLPWSTYPRGESRHLCPQCAITHPHNRDKTLSIRIDADGAGIGYCHRCQFKPRTGKQSHLNLAAIPKLPVPEKHDSLTEYGLTLWDDCQQFARDCDGAKYLRARKCVLPPPGGDLRFHPNLSDAVSGYRGAALVGLISDPLSGVAKSLHFTWVKANGEKAAIPNPKRTLKGHSSIGVIRLFPDEFATT